MLKKEEAKDLLKDGFENYIGHKRYSKCSIKRARNQRGDERKETELGTSTGRPCRCRTIHRTEASGRGDGVTSKCKD